VMNLAKMIQYCFGVTAGSFSKQRLSFQLLPHVQCTISSSPSTIRPCQGSSNMQMKYGQ